MPINESFFHLLQRSPRKKAEALSRGLEITFDFDKKRGEMKDLAMGKDFNVVYIDGKFHTLDK